MLAVVRMFPVIVIAALVAAFGIHTPEFRGATWITVGIFVDFCLGTFGGSNACMSGAIGVVCAYPQGTASHATA
jgi:hypothetical protein